MELADAEKAVFQRILNKSASNDEYNTALKSLCRYLSAYYDGKKIIVLIDEYDTPFQMALYKRYYEELQPIMRVLIGSVLKGNDFLEKAVVTGILRIAGAGLFSGANNVSAYTVLDTEFSEHFGFTEDEIKQVLSTMERNGVVGAKEKFPEISRWYNGYQFGETIIYNPWSTMVCFSRGFKFAPHWVNTSDDKLLKELLPKASPIVQSKLTDLMEEKSPEKMPVEVIVRQELRFDEDLTPDEHIWSLLLSAGYLKVTKGLGSSGLKINCVVEIPNREVQSVYLDVFSTWLEKALITSEQNTLINYLLMGNIEAFTEGLKRFYMQAVSPFDVGSDKIEAFYHGFMIGLLGLCQMHHKSYLYSNQLSGLGRYDLVIEPREPNHPKYHTGIVLEFKRTLSTTSLANEAQEGLKQIKTMKYHTGLQERGIKNIVMIGIAFCGKELESTYEAIDAIEAMTEIAIPRTSIELGLFGYVEPVEPVGHVEERRKRSLSEAGKDVVVEEVVEEPKMKRPK